MSQHTDVYEVVRLIPTGKISTYGAIGNYLNLSPRVVGWAMNGAHNVEPLVPAHRVVNRLGLLSGKMHFSTPNTMQEQLEAEGITVENDKVQNFEKHFWNPSLELI